MKRKTVELTEVLNEKTVDRAAQLIEEFMTQNGILHRIHGTCAFTAGACTWDARPGNPDEAVTVLTDRKKRSFLPDRR